MITITLEGGLVQGVYSDDPAVVGREVIVNDYDKDGCPDEELADLFDDGARSHLHVELVQHLGRRDPGPPVEVEGRAMKIGDYDYPEPGCYVDCSAFSAQYLNERICNLAEAYGFDIPLSRGDCDEFEFWNELADEAVDFLNELETREGYSWEIADNSLFLLQEEFE